MDVACQLTCLAALTMHVPPAPSFYCVQLPTRDTSIRDDVDEDYFANRPASQKDENVSKSSKSQRTSSKEAKKKVSPSKPSDRSSSRGKKASAWGEQASESEESDGNEGVRTSAAGDDTKSEQTLKQKLSNSSLHIREDVDESYFDKAAQSGDIPGPAISPSVRTDPFLRDSTAKSKKGKHKKSNREKSKEKSRAGKGKGKSGRSQGDNDKGSDEGSDRHPNRDSDEDAEGNAEYDGAISGLASTRDEGNTKDDSAEDAEAAGDMRDADSKSTSKGQKSKDKSRRKGKGKTGRSSKDGDQGSEQQASRDSDDDDDGNAEYDGAISGLKSTKSTADKEENGTPSLCRYILPFLATFNLLWGIFRFQVCCFIQTP